MSTLALRYLAPAALLLIATCGNVGAGAVGRVELSGNSLAPSVQLVQEKRTVHEQRKSETITERVKRAWKDLVGYKFDVSCPVVIPLSRTTCSETGKDRNEAREKCISRNPFCFVADATR